MSTHYLITPHTKAHCYIEPYVFLECLKKKWPLAQISPVSSIEDAYLFEWFVQLNNGNESHGLLSKDLKSIAFWKGPLESHIEFAVWFQSLYAEMKDLLFFDEQFSFDVDLYGRTEEEILQLVHQDYSFTRSSHSADK